MSRGEQSHFVVRPLRGMDQRWRPAPNSAAVVRDMRWNEKDGWEDSGGFREATNANAQGDSPFLNQGTITRLHWFAQHNGARQWLVWTDSSGRLRVFNGSGAPGTPWTHMEDLDGTAFDGSGRSRTVLSTPWQGEQFQAWGGRLYMVNGYDEPLVFDGVKADRVGWTATPAAPHGDAVEGVATNLVAVFGFGTPKVCARRIRVSFVNERGQESMLSEPSNSVTVSNSASSPRSFIAWTIPRGPDECVARRIYATMDYLDADGEAANVGLAEVYFFHTEIQDNETELYEDYLPDGLLGDAVDTLDFGAFPQRATYIAVFKNTMFLSVDGDIQYSAPGYPEVFPPENRIPLSDDSMGPTMGMRPTHNALVVFKQRGIYLIKGDPVSGFEAFTLTRDHGNACPNALVELPGLGLFFVDESGCHILLGALENTGTPTSVRRLSTPIPDEVKRFNTSALINACAAIYHHDKELWFCVPTIGNDKPNRALVFSYEVGEWSFRDDFPANTLIETRDHRGLLYMGSGSTAANKRGLLVYSPGFADKGGVAIATLYQTNPIDLGDGFRSFDPMHVLVRCIGYGNNNLNLNYRINRDIDTVRAAAAGTDQQDHAKPLAVYGTGLWGTAKWGEHRPVEVTFDLSSITKGPAREIAFTLTPASRRIQLLDLDFISMPGAARKVLPPTKDRGPSGRVL